MSAIRLFVVITLFCFMPTAGKAAEQKAGSTEITLSSAMVYAIEQALPVLRRRHPGWREYQLDVSEEGSSIFVVFWRPEDLVTLTMHFEPVPGYPNALTRVMAPWSLVVEVDKKTMRVVKWNYNRD